MVILVVHAIHVLPGTSERHAPVAAHLHGPRALSGATEFMEVQAGQVHIARAGRDVQTAEDEAEPVGVLRLNSRLVAGGEEPFDSFVPESFDRHAYKCNLYGYRLRPARPGGPGVRELRSMGRRLAGCIPQAWRGGEFFPRGLGGSRRPHLRGAGVIRPNGEAMAFTQLMHLLAAGGRAQKYLAESARNCSIL